MSEGFEILGKATAGLAVLAAVGGIVYGIHNVGYQSGVVETERVMGPEHSQQIGNKQQAYNGEISRLNKNHKSEIEKLQKEGRLIPEDSCLRYSTGNSDRPSKFSYGTTVNGPDEIIKGSGKCSPLELKVSWKDSKKDSLSSVSTQFRDHKAKFSKTGIQNFQMNKAKWVQYQRK